MLLGLGRGGEVGVHQAGVAHLLLGLLGLGEVEGLDPLVGGASHGSEVGGGGGEVEAAGLVGGGLVHHLLLLGRGHPGGGEGVLGLY